MSLVNVLLIFAKYPDPGKVKTRMQPQVSAQDAAELYRAMVEDLYVSLARSDNFDTIVCFTPESKRNAFKNWLGSGVSLKNQCEGNLGDKLGTAFKSCFNDGYKKVIAIGGDCVTVTAEEVSRAFGHLDTNDAVIGPTEDGGYYLIGTSAMIPGLFNTIAWSTERVFTQTIQILKSLSLRHTVLENKFDIDTVRDAEKLFQKIGGSNESDSKQTPAILYNILSGIRENNAVRNGKH